MSGGRGELEKAEICAFVQVWQKRGAPNRGRKHTESDDSYRMKRGVTPRASTPWKKTSLPKRIGGAQGKRGDLFGAVGFSSGRGGNWVRGFESVRVFHKEGVYQHNKESI